MENLNIVDLASRTHNDQILAVTEVLAQTNQILTDMPMVECNDGTGYKSVIRTGLPEVGWRKLNYGVKQGKSETKQVRDGCGMLEAWALTDEELYNLAKDKAAFLKSECDAFLERMGQEWADAIFYGDLAESPEKFNGLSARYCSMSGKAPSIKNVIPAGSTVESKNTSVWLVGWSSDKVHGIYTQGSTAGIKHEDEGKKIMEDDNGGKLKMYVNHFKANVGLTVRDWRYVVRICNINTTDIKAGELMNLMVKAKNLIPNIQACKPVFYANRDIVSALEIAYKDKSNVMLSLAEAQNGMSELRASGIPVHICDGLKNDEKLVK